MKLEQDIQKRFIEVVTSLEDMPKKSEKHQVYSDLIYYSFAEVIQKAFPRFTKLIPDEVFKTLIYNFINFGAKNPLYWQVAKEFRNFLILRDDLEIAYLEDLLNFEYLEVEMYMFKYTEFEFEEFSLEYAYSFSKDARIQSYHYPIHHPEFDHRPDDFTVGEHIVLFYYDSPNEQILSEEITPFVKEFLSALDDKLTLMELMKEFSFTYEIELEELVEILSEVLQKYHTYNIIIKV